MLFGQQENEQNNNNNNTSSDLLDTNHQRCLNYYNNLKKKRKLERQQQQQQQQQQEGSIAIQNKPRRNTHHHRTIINDNMTETASTSPLKLPNIILIVTWIVIAYITGPMCTPGSSTSRNMLADAKIRTEDATGITFATNEKFHISGRTNMSLAGVGVRKLAIISLYSMGLYVTPSTAKSLDKLDGSKGKCKAVLDSTSPKTVQLKFAMGIGPEKIAEALSAVDANENVKKEFQTMIIDGMGSEGKMKKGQVMSLEWKGTDVISVSIRGKYIGQMKDKALASGVIQLYLGSKSVSPSLRHDLGCV